MASTAAPEKTMTRPRASEAEAAAREFQNLSATWRRETALCSSVPQIALNPAYQQIIGF